MPEFQDTDYVSNIFLLICIMKFYFKSKFVLVLVALVLSDVMLANPKVSKYEFWWSFWHPVAAIKVKKVYKKANAFYNESELSKELDSYSSGGKLDAFRHVFYMAAFAQKVNGRKLIKLGKAHEKSNYLQFKRGNHEEGELPDSAGSAMDFLNNEIGVRLGIENKSVSLEELKNKTIELVKKGEAMIILRNKEGKYINCNNEVIDMELYKGKWNNPKCICCFRNAATIENN